MSFRRTNLHGPPTGHRSHEHPMEGSSDDPRPTHLRPTKHPLKGTMDCPWTPPRTAHGCHKDGHPIDTRGLYMDPARMPHGCLTDAPQSVPCRTHAPSTEGPRSVHGESTGSPRTFHGLPPDCPRTVRGWPTAYPKTPHGLSIDTSRTAQRRPHGLCMDTPTIPQAHPTNCSVHGQSVGYAGAAHGVSMDSA